MEQGRAIRPEAVERISAALIKAARVLPDDIERRLEEAMPSGGKAESVMDAIRRNLGISRKTGLPMCQDTGAFWCLAEIGRDSDASLAAVEALIIEGAAKAAEDGFFRRSIVSDPAGTRANTGTNLPPFAYYEPVEGDRVVLHFLLKGFGSENCSSVRMLNPTAGEDGVVKAVVDMMRAAGGKPCPPVFLGVGVGGTMDRAALLSKKAFFHGKESRRMLDAVNALGIGPGGLGGHPTALGVAVLSEPTHIAGLPVALTVNCWAERKATIVFKRGEI